MKRLLLVVILLNCFTLIQAQCPAFLGTGFETVPSIPFADNGHDTSADVDDINSANVASVCDANYLLGFDYVYIFTPTVTQAYIISLTNQSSIWGGIHVYDDCPDTGTCVADATTSSNSDIINTTLNAGTTYYIIADIYATPNSYTYDFSIEVPAPPPANDECAMATPIACDDLLIGETTDASTDNGDDTGCFVGAGVWYEFTGIDGSITVNVQPEAGFDPELAVASSSDCTSFTNVGCADSGGSGTAEEITFTAVSGTTYYFYVGHYTSGTTFGDFDISVTCSTCIEPVFTVSNGTNDCPAGTAYGLNVDITSIGSSTTTVDITYDDGSGPVNVNGVGVGSTPIGPFAPGTTVDVTVADSGDGTCSSMASASTPSTCPPANDDCGGAIALTVNADLNCTSVTPGTIANATASPEDPSACSGTEDDDVWFTFVATATEHPIELLNITGGTTDLYHSVWEGTCGSLTLLAGSCSDPNTSTATGLTPGLTYYLRVYSWTSTSGQTSMFDVCIKSNPPPPAEDVCTGAITIPVTADMCTGITTGNNSGATDSNSDVPAPPAATCTAYAGGDIWFKLTVPASGNVVISGANSDDCCSYLWYEIYTGADCSALTSIGCSDTNSGSDNNDPSTYETSLSGLTPGEMVWIRAWDSSNDNGPGDFNFCAYELSCTAPTVTIPVDPIDNSNCPTTVDVSISIDDLGDSGTLTISAEDDLGNPAGTGGMTSSTGIFTVTNIPVPQTSWSIIIAHESNPTCDVVLGPFLLNCPPLNDAACDAEALTVDAAPTVGQNAYSTFETNEVPGSCWVSTTVANSVWYSFVAPGSGLVEITTDFVTPLNDTQISLYTITDCADLLTANEIGCDEDGGDTGDGWNSYIETSGAPLVGGDTYYVQVDGYAGGVGEFNIQVNELAPANDDCVTSALLAMNTTGSLIDQYFAAATPSGMGAEICDVAGTPTPNDVWYEIDTDADGGDLIVIVEPGPNSDVVVAIYDACGSPIPEQCVDLGGNGGIETINFNANFQSENGVEATTRDADTL